ncbi:DUF1365 family protein [Mesorhizobium sp. M1406]|uniref:DUF1365 family protein n=1 Tax=Mesorhizobium sp. M1406 TaxID=2957099 RepID=UPI00333D0CA2
MHAGESNPLGTAQLAACLLKFPLMTWKIVARIHWEALKLRRKRARASFETADRRTGQLPGPRNGVRTWRMNRENRGSAICADTAEVRGA